MPFRINTRCQHNTVILCTAAWPGDEHRLACAQTATVCDTDACRSDTMQADRVGPTQRTHMSTQTDQPTCLGSLSMTVIAPTVMHCCGAAVPPGWHRHYPSPGPRHSPTAPPGACQVCAAPVCKSSLVSALPMLVGRTALRK
jgi:hypothetical protein